MKSKAKTTAWARRYRTALRRFLRQVPAANPVSAEKLGCQAAALGLETLSIAGIHKRALKTVMPTEDAPENVRQAIIKRAETFFKETIVPIEATHPAARKADARIVNLNRTLHRRTGKLSESSDELKRATARRKEAEARTEERVSQHDELLVEARRIQQQLRNRMRAILTQQENEQKLIGGELRDEIAQTLLALNISLSALNTTDKASTEKIEKSIANAHQILLESKISRKRGHND